MNSILIKTNLCIFLQDKTEKRTHSRRANQPESSMWKTLFSLHTHRRRIPHKLSLPWRLIGCFWFLVRSLCIVRVESWWNLIYPKNSGFLEFGPIGPKMAQFWFGRYIVYLLWRWRKKYFWHIWTFFGRKNWQNNLNLNSKKFKMKIVLITWKLPLWLIWEQYWHLMGVRIRLRHTVFQPS